LLLKRECYFFYSLLTYMKLQHHSTVSSTGQNTQRSTFLQVLKDVFEALVANKVQRESYATKDFAVLENNIQTVVNDYYRSVVNTHAEISLSALLTFISLVRAQLSL